MNALFKFLEGLSKIIARLMGMSETTQEEAENEIDRDAAEEFEGLKKGKRPNWKETK